MRNSPVNNVQRLKAPVFIAHGKQNSQIVPFKHATNLRKAMKKHKKPFEWFFKNRKGYSYYDVRNQVEFLNAALAFMSKHVGKERN